mgnify:CR=1 FL=1
MTATRGTTVGFVLVMSVFPVVWACVVTSLGHESAHRLSGFAFFAAVVGLIGFVVEAVRVKRLSPEWKFAYAATLYCVGLVGAVIIGVRAPDKQIIFAYGAVLLTALSLWIRIAMVSSGRQHKAADDAPHST